MNKSGSILLADYASGVLETDVLDVNEITPVLLGLFGEVGGIMSTSKKATREKDAYPGHKRAAEEEFGDTLWYLAALCRRLGIRLDDLFDNIAKSDHYTNLIAANDMETGSVARVATPITSVNLDKTLFELGRAAALLLEAEPKAPAIEAFARHYLDALHASNLSFAKVARANMNKARGAFLEPAPEDLYDFDAAFGIEEQIPRNFEIRVNQRASGKSYLQWNGVFIGDPLTDNIRDPDGYRFHDVFHFAYGAILHWSPVFRSLIKHKRKSVSKYDEEEDSGRAIVVEEGLSAWIFTRAKELNYFEGQTRLSLGILKNIQEFVSEYEVEKCPLKLWERAILDGYKVFRQIRAANGGWIIGDRAARSISFKPLESDV